MVIPTYNQAHLLQACLSSLVDQTLERASYELLAVDDGSTDHTPEVLREFVPHARAVRFGANRGRSAARNAGIREAAAPLIVFVDSDVVVRPGFLEGHLRTHRQHGPGILSRGPVIPVQDPVEAAGARIRRLAASPAYLDTANAGVEKAVLVQAGLFDEGFPGYGWEDFELGLRLKRMGIRRVFCRQAAAFHVQSTPDPSDLDAMFRKEEERALSAAYFYRKHPTLGTRFLIQATALHRAAFWLQSAGGRLTPRSAVSLARQVRQAGFSTPAHLLLRGVLNRHYVHTLRMELTRRAPAPV